MNEASAFGLGVMVCSAGAFITRRKAEIIERENAHWPAMREYLSEIGKLGAKASHVS